MPSDLQTYLASKYLTGAKAEAILARAESSEGSNGLKRKKKKRKVDSETSQSGSGGLSIADDDGMSWARKDDDSIEQEELEDGRPGKSLVLL